MKAGIAKLRKRLSLLIPVYCFPIFIGCVQEGCRLGLKYGKLGCGYRSFEYSASIFLQTVLSSKLYDCIFISVMLG